MEQQLFCLPEVSMDDLILGKGNRKLTEYKVKQVRAARAAGVPWTVLAKRYKVHPSTLRSAVERRTWKYVTD